MPTVQVINRQEDPDAKLLTSFGNDIADTLYKQQSLKLTGQYYKILAKNAQTEQDKFKFERLSKLNSDILPQIAATQDPTTKSMLIKGVVDSGMYQGDTNTFFHDVADSHATTQDHYQNLSGKLDSMKAAPGSYASEGQLRGAQVANQGAEARLHTSTADLYQKVLDDMQKPTSTGTDSGVGGNTSTGTGPGVGGSTAASGGQGAAAYPSLMFSGLSPTGPQFESPRAAYLQAAAQKAGGQSVPQNMSDTEVTGLKNDVDQIQQMTQNVVLLSKNPKAYGEMLGPGPIEAAKRGLAPFTDNTGTKQAFLGSVQRVNQTYRHAVTGAQAGFQEINYLIGQTPNPSDKPGAFIAKSYLQSKTALNALERQIPLLKATQRDTAGLEQLLPTMKASLTAIRSAMTPEQIKKLDGQWDDQGFIKPGEGFTNSVAEPGTKTKNSRAAAITNGNPAIGKTAGRFTIEEVK